MSEIWRLSGAEVTRRIKRRYLTAREATEAALARLDAVNPKINAITTRTDETALEAADQVDAAVARGQAPPLAGMPVTVKENVDQAGYATTNGLRMQKNLVAEADNPVVANLKRAGAIIVGRTNMPAFGLRWFTRNALEGGTLNPWNPALTPGGSSGGAAAATASGIGAMGHGTDIGGSVRYPAYACGLQGLRPTLGRFPVWNPSSPDRHIGGQIMAVSGPHARTVEDLAVSTKAMMAPDLRDPWHTPAPFDMGEYPRKAALCVAPEGLATQPAVEASLREAEQRLSDAGWDVEEIDGGATPGFREPARLQAQLWLAEMRRGGGQAIADENDPDTVYVYAEMQRLSPDPSLNDILDALQARLGLLRAWQAFFAEYPVLICPVSAEPPFPDHLDTQDFPRCIEAQLTQVGLPLMGLPGLTVFTGFADTEHGRAPLGAQLLGARFREDILLA
ncbi:MAG: amidase family protein, partial [Pseudomonadota bacterium]